MSAARRIGPARRRYVICVVAMLAGLTFLPNALAFRVFLHVHPLKAAPGTLVLFTGSAGTGCSTGDPLTLISRLFPGHAFGGQGAVTIKVRAQHHFGLVYRIRADTPSKKYVVTARCGGGNLGVSATLRVTH